MFLPPPPRPAGDPPPVESVPPTREPLPRAPFRWANLPAAALYLIAAMATGRQVYLLMMWGVWGRRSHPIEYLALLGALTLAAAAVVAVGHARRGGATAVVGCGLLWAFYAPALVATAKMAAAGPHDLEVTKFLPPLLLECASLVALLAVLRGGLKRC